jgi:preprotein translocase subunit YajC
MLLAPMVVSAVPMAEGGGGGGFTLLLPLILIIGMIWFMSRTQRKQRQRQEQTVAALTPGTRVVTSSGQLGTVWEVGDEFVTLEIAPDVYVQYVKQAIGRVLPPEEEEADETDHTAENGVVTDDEQTPGEAKGDVKTADDADKPAAKTED